MKAVTALGLEIKQRNEVGAGAKVFGVLAEVDINVVGFSAWTEGPDAIFLIVVDRGAAGASEALEQAGYAVTSEKVILVKVPNNPGALATLLQRLAIADIDLDYAYGSVESFYETVVVVKSSDNAAALREIEAMV